MMSPTVTILSSLGSKSGIPVVGGSAYPVFYHSTGWDLILGSSRTEYGRILNDGNGRLSFSWTQRAGTDAYDHYGLGLTYFASAGTIRATEEICDALARLYVIGATRICWTGSMAAGIDATATWTGTSVLEFCSNIVTTDVSPPYVPDITVSPDVLRLTGTAGTVLSAPVAISLSTPPKNIVAGLLRFDYAGDADRAMVDGVALPRELRIDTPAGQTDLGTYVVGVYKQLSGTTSGRMTITYDVL